MFSSQGFVRYERAFNGINTKCMTIMDEWTYSHMLVRQLDLCRLHILKVVFACVDFN